MFKVLNKKLSSQKELDLFLDRVKNEIVDYPFFHYKNYPSKNNEGWIELLIDILNNNFNNEDCFILYEDALPRPLFIVYHLNKWDIEHFGIKMAKSSIVVSFPEVYNGILLDFTKTCIEYLKSMGVKFVTTRINGDNLTILNAFFRNDFEYVENVIWPILNTKQLEMEYKTCDILTNLKDLNEVKNIASNYQYQRGHFHSDSKFDVSKVNEMYSKWVETSFHSNDDVCIIRDEDKIVGYFVCGIDTYLERFFGYKYGRLKSLALNGNYRGKKLGMKLFEGTLNYLFENGCDYIDSGYSTKNHISARLHTTNNFNSYYEELTLHKWL